MIKKNRISICTIIFTLLISLCACGGSDTAEKGDSSASQPVTIVQPDTVEQAVQSVDAFISADKLIGSWTDVTSPDRFVNITQTETGYQYEDNEGKYPATYEDGKLIVKVSDTDTADAYIDGKTGHLLLIYQENISEYQKK